MQTSQNEHKALILLSRFTFSQKDENELYKQLSTKLNWQLITGIAIRNKILGLLWYNLVKRNYHHVMPKQFRLVYRYFYENNIDNNLELIEQYNKISSLFRENNLAFVPLKGIYFLNTIYTDIGSRQLGDVDLLIRGKDYKTIKNLLNSIQYVEGEYEYVKKTIIPINRKLEIMHQTQLGNFHPFKKIADEGAKNEVYSIDFTHHIYGDYDGKLSEQLLCSATSDTALYFIYLCGHLYKEAINAYWVHNSKDNNLIKFCDLFEFTCHYISPQTLQEQRIQKIFMQYPQVADGVYYTLYYLKKIYTSDRFELLMNTVTVKDTSIVNSYIVEKNGTRENWESDFYDRMYYGTGKQELKEKPKYMQYQINPSDQYIKIE